MGTSREALATQFAPTRKRRLPRQLHDVCPHSRVTGPVFLVASPMLPRVFPFAMSVVEFS
jgi:hypothetical protein